MLETLICLNWCSYHDNLSLDWKKEKRLYVVANEDEGKLTSLLYRVINLAPLGILTFNLGVLVCST